MKKALVLILTLAMVLSTAVGCGSQDTTGSEDSSATENTEKKDISDMKVALFLKNQINAVFLECQYGAEACAEEMGFTLDTMAPATAGSSDEQNDLIISAISAGYDAFVISPCDAAACCAAVDMAREAGIKVIIVADTVTGTDIDGTVIADNKEAAMVSFSKLCEAMGGEGNVVIIRGTLSNSAADDHVAGVEEVLKDYPDIQVLDIQPGDYLRTTANTVMEAYLQAYEDIDGLWAGNDEMALGAVEAIKAAGKATGMDGIKITSLDASVDGCQAMKNGDILFDVDKNWSGVGYYGALNAVKAAMGEEYDPNYIVDLIEVTSENVDEILTSKT